MFKKKIIVAGMTAFAITTMAGITALASQEFGNQDMPVRNMQNQNFGESFDKGFERGGLFNGGNIGHGMMNNGAFDESNIPSDMPQNKNNTEGFSNFENSLSDTDNDQSGERPEFGGVDNQSTERPVFGETDNQSGEQPTFGGADNQSGEQPTFGGADNQSGEQPTFGGADNQSGGKTSFEGGNNQSTDNPTFGEADNQSGNKPSLVRKSDEEAMKEGNPTPELPDGVTAESFSNKNKTNKGMKTDNQSGERSVFGGADNQPDERPEFGGVDNQSSKRPAFEGGNNQSTDRPTFGTGDNQSGNRPSLGRKSDEEAMKEGNPTPELPEGVTMENTGIENMNNSAFGLGGMMEQGFSAGNSSQYFGMNQNARDEQSYNAAEDSGISAYRPAFAGSDNQSTDQPIFEESDNNQLSERSKFGVVGNQSGERPAYGEADSQSGEHSTFGVADNQSGERPAFEGGNNQSTAGTTFGTSDNQSGNRPSLGRKSDEEAMKEDNPRPELPEGVTANDAGIGA